MAFLRSAPHRRQFPNVLTHQKFRHGPCPGRIGPRSTPFPASPQNYCRPSRRLAGCGRSSHAKTRPPADLPLCSPSKDLCAGCSMSAHSSKPRRRAEHHVRRSSPRRWTEAISDSADRCKAAARRRNETRDGGAPPRIIGTSPLLGLWIPLRHFCLLFSWSPRFLEGHSESSREEYLVSNWPQFGRRAFLCV